MKKISIFLTLCLYTTKAANSQLLSHLLPAQVMSESVMRILILSKNLSYNFVYTENRSNIERIKSFTLTPKLLTYLNDLSMRASEIYDLCPKDTQTQLALDQLRIEFMSSSRDQLLQSMAIEILILLIMISLIWLKIPIFATNILSLVILDFKKMIYIYISNLDMFDDYENILKYAMQNICIHIFIDLIFCLFYCNYCILIIFILKIMLNYIGMIIHLKNFKKTIIKINDFISSLIVTDIISKFYMVIILTLLQHHALCMLLFIWFINLIMILGLIKRCSLLYDWKRAPIFINALIVIYCNFAYLTALYNINIFILILLFILIFLTFSFCIIPFLVSFGISFVYG